MQKHIESVGVIAARFQEPQLHEGHRFLIDYVLARHKRILIILGKAYDSSRVNPLTVEMRRDMISASYPGMTLDVIESPSLPSSMRRRSILLDSLVEEHFPNHTAVIYGSRDSVIQKYVGKFRTHEVPTVFRGSATELRERIVPVNSVDFRKGVIWHAINEKPRGVPTTDIAILSGDRSRVLLVGKKDEEGKLRFPGAFFDPAIDNSLEETAFRTINKELPGVEFTDLRIKASSKIDDWRFRKTLKNIVTLFFTAKYRGGKLTVGKGVDTVTWVQLAELQEQVVAAHQPLVNLLNGE